MEFTSIVRKVNRHIVDMQEAALVWGFRRHTQNEDVERLIRYEMEALRAFALRHPLQMWNPLFVMQRDLGNELAGDILLAYERFKKTVSTQRALEATVTVEIMDDAHESSDEAERRIRTEYEMRRKAEMAAVRRKFLDARKAGTYAVVSLETGKPLTRLPKDWFEASEPCSRDN